MAYELNDGSSQTTVNSLTALNFKPGLSFVGAGVFIIGEMAGSGILALPYAVSKVSWYGIGMIIFCAIISAHASVYLAECWLMVEEKWPEYKEASTRNPLATIGEKSVAAWMKIVCSFFMDAQLYGVCVVFLILCAQLTKALYDTFVPQEWQFGFCLWIIIFGLIIIPLSWAGSPQDFPIVAYVAMSCTIISCILLIFILITQGPEKIKEAKYEGTDLTNFALTFGTILFVYGGTCTFPTFQNDMSDKKQFPKAVYFGFLGMLLIYLPIATGGYAIYGVQCKENILDNTNPGPITTVINFLMAFHIFCAYLICINPLNLDLENALNIKHSFNFKRCLFRACMTLSIIFVALSIPKFGKILNLVGAFSVSAVAYVLTPWFYISLCRKEVGDSPARTIPTYRLCYLIFLILVGLIGGLISTYAAIADIVKPDTFVKPCYFDWR